MKKEQKEQAKLRLVGYALVIVVTVGACIAFRFSLNFSLAIIPLMHELGVHIIARVGADLAIARLRKGSLLARVAEDLGEALDDEGAE